jgi:hypothetical protein
MVSVFDVPFAIRSTHNLAFDANVTGNRPVSRLPSIFGGARGSNSKTKNMRRHENLF